jgi:sensor histidine kinase YesM
MNFQKTKSLAIVFSGYIFWIALQSSLWIYYVPEQLSFILRHNSTRLILGLVLCAFLVSLQLKILARYSSKTFLSVTLIFIASLLFAFVHAIIDSLSFNYWENKTFNPFGHEIVANTHLGFLVFLGLTGLLYNSYYRNITKQQKEQIARSKALADEAQLLMLRYQINPHFLFNSLNAIQSMIEKDKDRAKDMIADLSDYFRYTLSKNNQTLVSLQEEINAVQKYLAIQKERFAGRLEIEYEIEDASLKLMVPFFIIHPLVENAIKYGFSADNDILRLLIKVTQERQTLKILVKNTGKLTPSEQITEKDVVSTKTGIDNIKKRLGLFYPDCSSFELFEKDNWVHALITITHPSMSI